jgi:hypothetical protein
MSHCIEPRFVASCLSQVSGICDRLETYPDARQNCQSQLVKNTLASVKKLRSKPVGRKLGLD